MAGHVRDRVSGPENDKLARAIPPGKVGQARAQLT